MAYKRKNRESASTRQRKFGSKPKIIKPDGPLPSKSVPPGSKELDIPPAIGHIVWALDVRRIWCRAIVIGRTDGDVKVHYVGWNNKWDETIHLDDGRLLDLGTYTGMMPSWPPPRPPPSAPQPRVPANASPRVDRGDLNESSDEEEEIILSEDDKESDAKSDSNAVPVVAESDSEFDLESVADPDSDFDPDSNADPESDFEPDSDAESDSDFEPDSDAESDGDAERYKAKKSADGYELFCTCHNKTGYLGVKENKYGRFEARRSVGGKQVPLGTFKTAVKAAVAYAKDAAAAGEYPITKKSADGYTLFRTNHNKTGYIGVSMRAGRKGRFEASRFVDGKKVFIGMYDTAVEAAVAYAKHAAAAGEYPVRSEKKSADGYELSCTAQNKTGYVGVSEKVGKKTKFEARRSVGGKQVHIGMYDTAEEAAAGFARYAAGNGKRPRVEVKVTEANGYKLFISNRSALCTTTGYTGVNPQNGKFTARRKVDGKLVYIGTYDTAVEAAVAYAEHAAAAGEYPMTSNGVQDRHKQATTQPSSTRREAIGSAGGYQLLRSENNPSGYVGVDMRGGRFRASQKVGQKTVYIGTYDTAVEAAVAHAKCVAPKHVEMVDGYPLLRSEKNPSGYVGVEMRGGRFKVTRSVHGKLVYIGTYDTAVEAAVAHAKHVAAASEHPRTSNGVQKRRKQAITKQSSTRREVIGSAGGYQLLRSERSPTGYAGVEIKSGRFRAVLWDGNKRQHIGLFDTAVEAAVAYAEAHAKAHAKDNEDEAARNLETSADGYTLFLSRHSETGYKGVSKHHGRFKAMGWDDSKRRHKHIGLFDTAVEAAVAYAKAHAKDNEEEEEVAEKVAEEVADDDEEEVAEEVVDDDDDEEEEEEEEEEEATADNPRGYKLFRTDNNKTGYVGVAKQKNRFKAIGWVDGKQFHIGTFDTAVEAAVAYAKTYARTHPKNKEKLVPENLETSADGYTLLLSRHSNTGYRGVSKHYDRFKAYYREGFNGNQVHIGTFDTAVEAAVAYAKHAAGEAQSDPPTPENLETSADGYTLFLSRQSETGYKGVSESMGKFKVSRMINGVHHYLGRFDTAVEGAVAYAKQVERESQSDPPVTSSSQSDNHLFLSHRSVTGYEGVTKSHGKFKAARTAGRNRKIHIGTYNTAVEAAEAYAKYVAGEKQTDLPATSSSQGSPHDPQPDGLSLLMDAAVEASRVQNVRYSHPITHAD